MLSIIIPAFNERSYLPLLLGEIKKQDFGDCEIIVADADSSDGTAGIARDSGCRVVKGGLPSKGRNSGAGAAKGNLLLFIDADAVRIPKGFLKKLVSEFERRKLDVASFPIFPQGIFTDRVFYSLYNAVAKLTQGFLPHATNVILVRKWLHDAIGGFDEQVKFAEDHDYARRASKRGRFGFIEIEPVMVSARRFERDGRLATYLRYILAGAWMMLFGSIKTDLFSYGFGYPLKKSKKTGYNIFTMYKLPKIKIPSIKFPKSRSHKSRQPRKSAAWFLVLVIVLSSFSGFIAGTISGGYFYWEIKDFFGRLNIDFAPIDHGESQTFQEQAIISAVKKTSPAVVSIIITKDLPVYEQYYDSPFNDFFLFDFQIPMYRQTGTEKKEIGGGTGFIVSEEGMIVTNKHVVLDDEADYTVVTSDSRQFPAKVLAKDPLQDIAILKIEQEKSVTDNGSVEFEPFSRVELGDSDEIDIGQTAIAIGYVLGKYQNTVSVGIISGLGRTVEASGGDFVEVLEDVIQTDTAINKGNSGGPLLNTKGEVIGINTAIDLEGQSVGFSVPINRAKRDIEQVKSTGKIVYPFLGVRYSLINKQIQEENDLSVDYGAWIVKGSNGEDAVFPGSAAESIGLKEGDIVLEINKEKITMQNSLAKIISKYMPGDSVTLKVLVDGEEKQFSVVLGERQD